MSETKLSKTHRGTFTCPDCGEILSHRFREKTLCETREQDYNMLHDLLKSMTKKQIIEYVMEQPDNLFDRPEFRIVAKYYGGFKHMNVSSDKSL